MSLHDVLRHLIQYGPARDDREREQLLGQVDDDEARSQPQPDSTITVAEQRAAGVPPEETVTVAEQRAGAEVHPAALGQPEQPEGNDQQ